MKPKYVSNAKQKQQKVSHGLNADLNTSAKMTSSFSPDTSAQKEEDFMRRTAHSKIQTAAGSSLKDPDGLTSDGGV